MQEYKYISIPISYLESKNISKKSFMQDSPEAKIFLNKFLDNFPSYVELKNMFLINSSFLLALGNKQDIIFENDDNFNCFCEFISNSRFKDFVSIDIDKKEISVSNDISPIFYNILYEFLA